MTLQLSNILTAKGPSTMLRDRAADVPTGARIHSNATVEYRLRLRGQHVVTQAFLAFNSSPEPLGSAYDPYPTFAWHRGRPRRQLRSLASRRLRGARSRQHRSGNAG